MNDRTVDDCLGTQNGQILHIQDIGICKVKGTKLTSK